MRKEYKLTDKQFDLLLESSQPVPYMIFNGIIPESPQTKVNKFWETLGNELGFNYLTVKPSIDKDEKFFTAETNLNGGI